VCVRTCLCVGGLCFCGCEYRFVCMRVFLFVWFVVCGLR